MIKQAKAQTVIPTKVEKATETTDFNILMADNVHMGGDEDEVEDTEPVVNVTKGQVKAKAAPAKPAAPVENEDETEEEGQDMDASGQDEEEEDTDFSSQTSKPKKQPKSQDDEGSAYRAFAEFLGEQGVVEFNPDTFEASPTGLAKTIQTTINKEVDAYKSALGADSQKFIEYLENGGDPLKYIQAKASLNYMKMDDKSIDGNENMQRDVLKDLLSKDGYTEVEIEEKVKDYEDAGIMEREAQRALKRLKTIQQREDIDLVENQKKQRQSEIKAYDTYISQLETNLSKKQEIGGFPITERDKSGLFAYMTKPVDKEGRTQLIIDTSSDPDMQLNLAYAAYKKFNFSSIKKDAVTKATSSLRDTLGRFTDTRQKLNVSAPAQDDEKPDLTIFRKMLGA